MRSSEAVLAQVRGQRAVVIGLAREGVDLTRFLSRHGAEVTVTDTKPREALAESIGQLDGANVTYHVGGHQLEDVDQADVVYASPGVPPDNELLVRARARGVRQSSLVELFFALCPAPILGVTGSAGKSTTTSLLGEMFGAAGRDVYVGGNIGRPLLGKVEDMTERSWVVMELSSFQLEPLRVSPHVALITNVTPNHLDRHPTMEAYWAAKGQILAHQSPTDWSILNADDAWSSRYTPRGQTLCFSLEKRVEGAYLDADGERRIMLLGEPVIDTEAIPLRGRHNVANVLAAVAAAHAAGIERGAMVEAIRSFHGVAHRLQTVAERRGVTWVDDSIATAPERSIAALRAYHEPLVLIAGGRDKHLPMQDWAELIVTRAHHVVLLGEMGDLVQEAISSVNSTDPRAFPTISRADSMQEAVSQADRAARAGDVVLLSPGGTSYDMYRDFEERGRDFQRAVEALEP